MKKRILDLTIESFVWTKELKDIENKGYGKNLLMVLLFIHFNYLPWMNFFLSRQLRNRNIFLKRK